MTTLPQSPFVAQTQEQARLLLDLSYHPVLTVLLQTEASAGEVAGHTGLTVKQAHHRLTRLLGAGLAVVSGERERRGRPVKLYRAMTQVYRVPFALTSAVTMAELIGRMMEPFLDAYARSAAGRFAQAAGRDLVICPDAHGHLSVNLSGSDGADSQKSQGGFGAFTQLRLRRDTREELERRLRELRTWVATQEAGDEPGAAPCLLGLLFTPGRVEGL